MNARNEQFVEKYPTLRAAAPMPGVSNRYAFVPTTQIIDVMDRAGWNVHSVTEASAREVARLSFQRHEIRFMNETLPPVEVGNTFFQIVIINSHDRAAAVDISAGLWRFVCRNGMKVCESVCERVRIKHLGFAYDAVMPALESMTERLPMISEHVQEFKQIELTPDEAGAFAVQAARLRYDDEFLKTHRLDYAGLLRPERREDQGKSPFLVICRMGLKVAYPERGGGPQRRPESIPQGPRRGC